MKILSDYYRQFGFLGSAPTHTKVYMKRCHHSSLCVH